MRFRVNNSLYSKAHCTRVASIHFAGWPQLGCASQNSQNGMVQLYNPANPFFCSAEHHHVIFKAVNAVQVAHCLSTCGAYIELRGYLQQLLSSLTIVDDSVIVYDPKDLEDKRRCVFDVISVYS
jgi:hypothetical protein